MRRNLYICVGLVFLTVTVFWPVRNYPFVNYDDQDYVTANPVVQKGLTAEGMAWAFQNLHGEKTYWHPLTWVSHMLDCELFGLQSGAHHLVNVLFHLLNVVLLFWVLVRMTGAEWPSAAVAALFAIHPLQVETVAWVAERKNLLSTFFTLLSLLAYVRFAARPAILRYAPVFLLFAAALMSKPAVVAFPFLLLLLDYWPLQRIHLAGVSEPRGKKSRNGRSPGNPAVPVRRAVLEKVPLLVLSVASCAITILAHRDLGMIESSQMPSSVRMGNAVVSYLQYVRSFFWPHNMAVLYPHPGVWPRLELIWSAGFLLGITTLVLLRTKARPFLWIGWFWFLGMLVPAIGIVQVGAQARADRFVYMPLIGLLVMAIWGAREFFARLPARPFAPACLGLALAACVVITSLQLNRWKSSATLWQHTLHVTKNNWVAHHGLGNALIEQGDLENARAQLQSAISIKDNALSHSLLAYIFKTQQDTNRAIAELETSVRLDPRWRKSRELLANLLAHSSRKEEALTQYFKVLEQKPPSDDIHARVGILLYGLGRAAEAAPHYREALRLNATNVVALNNLAWILSTSSNDTNRDGREALKLAEQACILTRSNFPPFLMTLAAAQAECGLYHLAVATAANAREAVTAAGNAGLAAQYDELRAQFSREGPHREQ